MGGCCDCTLIFAGAIIYCADWDLIPEDELEDAIANDWCMRSRSFGGRDINCVFSFSVSSLR